MSAFNRIPLALFTLRVGVFIVMFMWTLDKFMRPEHASAIYEAFYLIGGVAAPAFYLIAVVELVVLIGFLVGFMKNWTYLLVLIMHGISTVSSYKQYMAPFQDANLLFFAALPMLSACFVLYYLRDQDSMCTVNR